MTVKEVIEKNDEFFPNVLPFTAKALWLKELDSKIYSEFLYKFRQNGKKPPEGEYLPSSVLLIPDEFCEVYLRYLTMQQDILNCDTVRYQNSASLFNSAFLSFMNYYNRTHQIDGCVIKIE